MLLQEFYLDIRVIKVLSKIKKNYVYNFDSNRIHSAAFIQFETKFKENVQNYQSL